MPDLASVRRNEGREPRATVLSRERTSSRLETELPLLAGRTSFEAAGYARDMSGKSMRIAPARQHHEVASDCHVASAKRRRHDDSVPTKPSVEGLG